jgi:hypothetical protein
VTGPPAVSEDVIEAAAGHFKQTRTALSDAMREDLGLQPSAEIADPQSAPISPFVSSASGSSVEVLTAEIRVLQVGSKPVPLSATRQLDSVDATAIKPFGRVRIDPKPATGLIEVIGSANGILARSSARARKFECPGYATSDLYRGYGPPLVMRARHRNTPPGMAPVTTTGLSTPRRRTFMKHGWRCP